METPYEFDDEDFEGTIPPMLPAAGPMKMTITPLNPLTFPSGLPRISQGTVVSASGAVSTSVLVQLYSDRILVTLTQVSAFGSVLTASTDVSPHDGRRTYDVEVLLGRRDDPLLCIYCRQLVEKAGLVDKLGRPVLLTICLKEDGRDSDTFQKVLNETLRMLTELL